MATQLQPGQELRRLVKVYGIEGLVEVKLSDTGIAFRIPKTKTGVSMTWVKAVAACDTPGNVKSYHAGKPTEFLLSQVVAKGKRAKKVLDNQT